MSEWPSHEGQAGLLAHPARVLGLSLAGQLEAWLIQGHTALGLNPNFEQLLFHRSELIFPKRSYHYEALLAAGALVGCCMCVWLIFFLFLFSYGASS